MGVVRSVLVEFIHAVLGSDQIYIYGEIQIRYIDQISSSLIPLLMLICDNLLVISSFVLVRAFSLRFSYAEVEYICNFWVCFPLMIPSSTLSL